MSAPISESIYPIEPPAQSPVSPDNPPWGSGIAVGIWLLSIFLIVLVPGLFLAPYAFSRRGDYADGAELIQSLGTDPTAIIIQLFAIIPAHLLTLGIAWLVVTKGCEHPFASTLGWRSGGMRWWHYVVIMAGFFALAAVVGYFLPEQENDMLRILRSSRYAVFVVAIMAVLTAPLVEEVVYRGLLYSSLQRAAGVGPAVAVVTFLFALVHLPQYYPSISTMILLTLLSLVLTLIRVKTGNLLPCVILHTIFNGVQAMLLIVEPYLKPTTNTIEETVAMFFSIK